MMETDAEKRDGAFRLSTVFCKVEHRVAPATRLRGSTARQVAVELMHRQRLMMRKGNRRSNQLSATNPVARELLVVTLKNCRIHLPTWFAEFIRWHEPNGL
jgi:hypothetical protein